MAKGIKFDPDKVKNKDVEIKRAKAINGAVIKLTKPDRDIAKLKFRRRYYNLETDKPLPLEEIQGRLSDIYKKLNRLSIEAMFDLFFIWSQWGSFYIRKESFTDFVKKNLPITRSYAYDIIKSVRLMIKYAENRIKVSDDPTLYIEDIVEPIEAAGLRKLKVISQVKDKNIQFKLLDYIISGKDLTEDRILEINKKELEKMKVEEENVMLPSWNYKYSSKMYSITIGEENNRIEFDTKFNEVIREDIKEVTKKLCDIKAKGMDVEIVSVSKIEEEKKELRAFIKKYYAIKESGEKPALIAVDPDNVAGELRAVELHKKKIRIK